ncbi:poly(ethylene terephthalate) hydrolase family protein [Sutcliffiella sp. NC1]|uniref:poly(ethylene terephthalate) hydrolase family protein n=1 Tax=Sutcliffiella sp. NC1 TaxID=3004096 RepID=UPI0022DDEC97|nr:hypothetical protein [Sutcliffiella sp. NC1]WBL17399.1 hypothetical protein O1A01_12510 [Sutcliffiella sp. NC1]
MMKLYIGINKLLQIIISFFTNSWVAITKGMLLYVPIFIFIMGYFLVLGVGKWFDILFISVLGIIGFVTSYIIIRIILLMVKKIPYTFIYITVGLLTAIYMVGLYLGPYFRYLAYMVLLLGAIIGFTISILRIKNISVLWKVSTVLFTITIHAIVIGIVITPGERGEWNVELIGDPPNLVNPAETGQYTIQYFTYGSGNDNRRDEFGDNVTYETSTVNMSPVTVTPKGINSFYRKWYWGFELNSAPLNGRVWMPKEGDGPHPLVLIVHGNHNMVEHSDRGYSYLGELLASKGYIAVSVDQNFLNSSKFGHIGWDNAGRAWLLLKHLEQWAKWNVQMDHDLYRKVDMNNIALIGHSRGGEAVSIAAVLNELERFPNNARVKMDFDFSIRALIGLSPGEGRFNPGDEPISLENINYLTIQGSHDTDHTSYHGIKTFNRVTFTENYDGFKSSIYIYGGNHGQFNKDWIVDRSPPYSWFINRSALLSPEMQQHITKFYVTAFLEASLKEKDEYRELFSNKEISSAWVPTDPLRIQFEDSDFQAIATFEEDVDVTTVTVPNGKIDGRSLRVWREVGLTLRNGDLQHNRAVKLGWLKSSSRYIINVPEDISNTFTDQTVLRFDAVHAHESRYTFRGLPIDEQYRQKSIPIKVSMKPKGIHQYDARIEKTIHIEPTFTSDLYRWDWRNEKIGTNYEHILQTYEIPISYLQEEFPNIAFDSIHEIVFSLNETDSGLIILDNIGFAEKAH